MLMDEQQVRLNEVRLQVREAMDFMEYLRDHHPEHSLSRDMEEHIAAYREMMEELDAELRQFGGLPREPDPEHELFEQMVAQLKSLFGQDRETVLLQEFNKYRINIVDTIQWALEIDYPDKVKKSLRGLSRYSREIDHNGHRGELKRADNAHGMAEDYSDLRK